MSNNGYKIAPAHAELTPDKLRWRCEASRLPFETTAQAELREGFIGQERALRALKMGVELSAPGYNVFVCGLAGTSRGGTIAQMIEELHPSTKPSLDRCYVNNFKIADRPRLLSLPRGQANSFKKDMQAGIDFLRRRIPQVFEGEPFQRQKGRIVERFTVREKELMDDFTRRIARDQFALGHMQVGAVALPEIFPVLEGQMVPIEDISKMVHEGKLDAPVAEEIERKYEQFRQEFTVVYRKTLTLSRELASELSYLEQEAASVLVDGVVEELKEKYPGTGVAEYLEEVRHHLLDNLDPFKEREGEGEHDSDPTPSPDGPQKQSGGPDRDPFRLYGVNVILAHGEEDTSPVIFETTPTYANLFGTIQRAYDTRGGWTSDFMDLRGGSLLRADGGFLIMYSMEAISETGVWRALKRTLNHNRLEIQPLEMFYPFGGSALKPEAVQINVKVILIGDRQMYELMYEYEEDFRKIFKVRVEFDEEMPLERRRDRGIRGTLAGVERERGIVAIRSRSLCSDIGVWRAAGRSAEQSDGEICRYCGPGARGALRCSGCGRIGGARGACAHGPVFKDGAAQSGGDAHPRDDRGRHVAGRSGRHANRAGEWAERAGDWRVFVREAGADYRDGGAREDWRHQY